VTADPSRPGLLLATSASGVWRSTDGGGTWEPLSAGLASPATSWALAEFDGHLYASDSTGIYRLDQATWRRSSDMPRVLSLDVAGQPRRLYASSIGGGIGVFDGQGWRTAQLTVGGHSAVHVSSVTGLSGGRLVAAAMGGGVLGSTDGGLSWEPFGAGLGPEVTRLSVTGRVLLAATGGGVYRYPLPQPSAAGASWWAIAVGLALAAGTVAAGVLPASPFRPVRAADAAGAGPAGAHRRRRWPRAPGESS
jgi:hypothetical protein